jgi:hypothetical protein
MAIPRQLNIALKEWASVCRALEEGRQILLLRKGGILDDAGEFRLENPHFLLFPTYLHQNLTMLKPSEHAAFVAMSEEPAQITLSAAAEATDVFQLKTRAQMDALDHEHIWTKPLIDMRFNYKPENPLYLLLLRVYRLAQPISIRNTQAYAGCKSWVPLTQSIDTSNLTPVMGEEQFQTDRERLRAVLA